MATLSKSAQRVQEALAEKGMQFKVVELADSTRTANDAAAAIGCQVAQIAKSLIFCTKDTKKPILVIARGDNHVSEKIISQRVGEKIVRPKADFVLEVTGFAIGGIPPVGHKQKLDTFIDAGLLQLKEIWAAAGTPHAVFSLKPQDLQALTGGEIIAIQ